MPPMVDATATAAAAAVKAVESMRAAGVSPIIAISLLPQMITLLVYEPQRATAEQPATQLGGVPSVPRSGFDWPRCRVCGGNMQFVGQVLAEDACRVNLIFMCQNDPGACDEWDANAGANAVVRLDAANLVAADVPSGGVTLRKACQAVVARAIPAEDYDAARASWAASNRAPRRWVVGQLGGKPAWLQGDETPHCDACASPMAFTAQLEEGIDEASGANFGGGCAYLFNCPCDGRSAKFLWQC